jgi:hypothetical protein
MVRSHRVASTQADARLDLATGDCFRAHRSAQDSHISKTQYDQKAARILDLPFDYSSRPNWETYAGYRALAKTLRHEIRSMRPRDMIDIQSFLWVQGSDEYR